MRAGRYKLANGEEYDILPRYIGGVRCVSVNFKQSRSTRSCRCDP